MFISVATVWWGGLGRQGGWSWELVEMGVVRVRVITSGGVDSKLL